MKMLLLLLFGACAVVTATDRIVEKDIMFPHVELRAKAGTPVVDPPKRIAGYFKLDRKEDAHMFYFLFGSRSQPTDPVVLWMQGGPGCSSELAVFYENGPYAINKDMSLSETPYGWDRFHTTIFVDQPVNTGFSYSEDEGDRVYDEAGVADDMLDFLQEFFEAHPELADRPLYLTGESYSGHYVPAVAHRIWLANKNKEGRPINLQGVAIGNGLTHPGIQFTSYADFALQNNLISQGVHDFINFLSPVCSVAANLCNNLGWSWLCGIGNGLCQSTMFGPILAANPGINVYDIRKRYDYDFGDADKFLNLESTRKALGVGDREWQGCDAAVYQDMSPDILKNLVPLIADMLDDGIRVMIYAGEQDLICNWLGNYRWVQSMEWEGAAQWKDSPEQEWTVLGEKAGSVKAAGPLSFVKVAAAGHMVPMDQPLNALSMITAFTRGKELTAIDGQLVYGSSSAAGSLHGRPSSEQHLEQQEDQMLQRLVGGVALLGAGAEATSSVPWSGLSDVALHNKGATKGSSRYSVHLKRGAVQLQVRDDPDAQWKS